MRTIRVSDFSKFPGPRYKKLGKYSGEEFRETVLMPEIDQGTDDLMVDLDGVLGYGSSFLEEAFGGLVRSGVNERDLHNIMCNLKSDEEPELIAEIKRYISSELSYR